VAGEVVESFFVVGGEIAVLVGDVGGGGNVGGESSTPCRPVELASATAD